MKRSSNIELLRIVAMFMVVLFHANMWSLECCYNDANLLKDYDTNFSSLLNINLESGLTCICVNLFVLISGFFSIKLELGKMIIFISQCLFVGLYLIVL